MLQVNIQEAKTQLSKLIRQVEAGEEVVLARSGRPIARLVLIAQAEPREPGLLSGTIDEAFFEDLPESELRAWTGE